MGAVDGVRTAGDLGEGRAITHPGTFFYPASYGINKLGFWPGPGRAFYNAASYYTHGRHRDEVEVMVPPESVRIYRLNEFVCAPRVIGSSTAFTGRDATGAWNETTSSLSIEVRRPQRERGIVYLFAPPGWHLENIRQGRIGKDMNSGELAVAVPFETSEDGVWKAEIRFGRHTVPAEASKSEAVRFG